MDIDNLASFFMVVGTLSMILRLILDEVGSGS